LTRGDAQLGFVVYLPLRPLSTSGLQEGDVTRKLLTALALSTALMGAATILMATEADAAMSYGSQSVVDLQHQIARVEKAQFV
jgi:2-keto-3-deoxy-6-phosphogluconate aldolase